MCAQAAHTKSDVSRRQKLKTRRQRRLLHSTQKNVKNGKRERERGQLSVHRLGWLNWSKLSNYSSSSSSDLVSQFSSRPTEFHSLWPLCPLLLLRRLCSSFGANKSLLQSSLSLFLLLTVTLFQCLAALPCQPVPLVYLAALLPVPLRAVVSHTTVTVATVSNCSEEEGGCKEPDKETFSDRTGTQYTHTGHKANTSSSSKN